MKARKIFLLGAWSTVIALLAWICKDEIADLAYKAMEYDGQPEYANHLYGCSAQGGYAS